MSGIKGRFAPSPTGRMHAGNIYAALCAWLVAKSQGGSIVLRIEDLDAQRSKPEYIDLVQRDFEMLGLTWDEGPYFQSTRSEAYEEALAVLQDAGLVYPCFCTRADLHAASAPHVGEHFVYAGTCRHLTANQRAEKALDRSPSLRLAVPDEAIAFQDLIQGQVRYGLAQDCGDFVVRRGDGGFAYQLAVVVDDAAQGVNSVVRGVDLLQSVPQQMHVQTLLGYGHPEYAHVPLLCAEDGRRLSKRNKDASMEELLARYGTPEGIIGHIAHVVGLLPSDEPATPADILKTFEMSSFAATLGGRQSINWVA